MKRKDIAEAFLATGVVLAVAATIGLVMPWAVRFFGWYWTWVIG